jgi:glucokinase
VGRQAIGIDLGGTKAAGLLLAEGGEVLAREQAQTPAHDTDATIETVFQVATVLAGRGEPSAIGVGVAGMVDFAGGTLRFAPNLPLVEVPLRDLVSERMGLPCLVDNDANVAAWGEFLYGAGRDAEDMLLVTVGTGIGGGIVSGGSLYRGAHGFAAEIGHVIVEPGGPLCGCGNRGCWEQVASGQALDRQARDAAVHHPDSLIAELAADLGRDEELGGRIVWEAARREDAMAVAIIEDVGRRLGQGIAGLVNVLDPEVVVVGGGVADIGDLLLGPARRAFHEAVEAVEHRPEVPILPAELGNRAGAIGAAALALDLAGGRGGPGG